MMVPCFASLSDDHTVVILFCHVRVTWGSNQLCFSTAIFRCSKAQFISHANLNSNQHLKSEILSALKVWFCSGMAPQQLSEVHTQGGCWNAPVLRPMTL